MFSLHNILSANIDRRSWLLAKNVLASFAIKGWSALLVLIMVPVTLECLGTYQNGVWLTISSMLVWIDQMDIGLGNGLRNKLAACIARNERAEARAVVSSTVAMLCIITIPMSIILSILVWTTDVYAFLNVEEALVPELRVSLACAVILICITFVLKFINNVYMGLQLPAVSNLIMAASQTLALVLTVLLLYTGQANFMNVVLANTVAPLGVYLMVYPITFKKYKWLRPTCSYVNLRSALELGNIGLKFFWLQIAAVIQFMTANILISKFFTPEMVTPYQVSYRYMSLIMVMFTVICMPFWNATTDAYERGDMSWIMNACKKMNVLTMLISLVLTVMTVISPYVYKIWVGDKCEVPFGMTVMMATYIFLMILSMRYSYFLNGIGALRLQMYMTVSSIIFIPLAWYVSRTTHDIMCFMGVMCLCNIPGVLVNIVQFNKIVRGKATGVWRI